MSYKAQRIITYGSILICCLIFLPQTIWGDPSTDCNVYGTLKINGQDAPVASHVEAYIDGERIASKNTTEKGKYSLTIPQYDPGDPDTKGYHFTSDVVVIKVDNREAEPTFNPRPGSINKNLEVKTTLNVKLTTWGKIKALFK